MGQADVRVPHAAIPGACSERSGEAELGRASRVRGDLHLSERRLENADAECFEAGFLGGESRGQRLDPIVTNRAGIELARGEYPLRKAARRGEGSC